MNNRSKLVGALIVFLLLLLGWWLWTSRQVKSTESQEKTATASLANTAVPNAGQPGASNPQPASAPTPTPINPKVAEMHAIVAAENSRSLDFYGKVIDQHGEPVAGVKVKAGVGRIVSFAESGGEYYYKETDAAGRFSFVGIHGAGVGFILTKEGYAFNQRQPASSRPKDYVPDPDNPTIFTMWKLQGAEPMVKARIHAYIPCDGTPTMFDLTTGKRVASGGNLTVRLSRDPVDIVRGTPFSWQLTLEVSGGGVQENSDVYPNEAPADGYQQSVTVSMPVGTKNWSPDFQKSYYFTTGNGQDYGRINIDLTGDFQPPPTSFDADIYVNTAGSRNLEFDPFKQVR
jgi:hypothetical protein